MLVEEASATFSLPLEVHKTHTLAISRDHSKLVKFALNDPVYFQILGYLQRFVQTATEVIKDRFPEEGKVPIPGLNVIDRR